MIVKFVEPSPFHTPVVSKYRHLYLHTANHRRCKRSLKFQWNLNTPVSNEVINTFYPSSFFSLPVDHLMKNPRLLCSFFSCAFSYVSLTSCACVYLPSSSSFDSSSSSSSSFFFFFFFFFFLSESDELEEVLLLLLLDRDKLEEEELEEDDDGDDDDEELEDCSRLSHKIILKYYT